MARIEQDLSVFEAKQRWIHPLRKSTAKVITEALSSKKYVLMAKSKVEEDSSGRDQAVYLAEKITKQEDHKSLRAHLLSSCMRPKASEVAQVQLRCKSHKEYGEVGFRMVSAVSDYKHASMTKWLAQHCRKIIASYTTPHLVISSPEFVASWKDAKALELPHFD